MAVNYEIVKKFGVLSENGKYKKEVNLVSWNDGEPKMDIRIWLPSGKPGKGISLSNEEVENLKGILPEIKI